MADIRTILANNANSSFKKRKEKQVVEATKEEKTENLMKVQPSVRDSGEALYGVALGDFPLSDDVLGRDEILNENGHILSGLVATESMLSNSIDGDRIASGSLSGKKIKDGTIESSKIGAKQVKTSNLDDSAVTTSKIQDGSVTPEKLSKTYAEASSLTGYVPLSGGEILSEFALKIDGVHVLSGLDSGLAIGKNSIASDFTAVAVGVNAIASADYSIAIGNNAKAPQKYSLAIGVGTMSIEEATLALGHSAKAVAEQSTALGNSSEATKLSSTAVGYRSLAYGERSVAVGHDSKTSESAIDSVAVGRNAHAEAQNAIAIGSGAYASGKGSIQLGGGENGSLQYNSVPNTFQVWNYPMLLSSTGKIPAERIPDNYALTSQIPTTVSSLSDASNYALKQEVQDAFDDISRELSNEINPKISAIAEEVSAEVRRMDELSGKVEGLSGTVVRDYALKTEIPLSVGQLVNDKDYVASSDVSVFAKDDAVVHLSGNEVLSGRLSADFFRHIDNPLGGMAVAEIGNDVSAILEGEDSNTITYAYAMLYGRALSVAINIDPYSEIPDIVIENEKCESWINDWTDGDNNQRRSDGTFFASYGGEPSNANIEIYASYDPNDSGGEVEYSFEEMYSTTSEIKDMLTNVATGNMEIPTDGQRVLSVEWYVRDSHYDIVLHGRVNDGQILDPLDPAIEALYHLQTNQYLSTWTDHDEFALTSEIKEGDDALSSLISNLSTDLNERYLLKTGGSVPNTFTLKNPSGTNVLSGLNNNIAIGLNSLASSGNSLAIGINANAKGGNSLAIGPNTNADGQESIAIGRGHAVKEYDIAIGSISNTAMGGHSLAIGHAAKALSANSIAIGSTKENSQQLVIANAIDAIQIGRGTNNNEHSLQIYDWPLLNSNGKIPSDRIDYTSIEKSAIPLSGGIVSSNKLFQDSGGTGAYNPKTDYNYWELGELAYPNGKNNPSRYIPIFKVTRPWDTLLNTEFGQANLFIGLDAKALGATNNGFDIIPQASIAIGSAAQISSSETVRTNKAIQLGNGINSNSNTFQVWDHTLMDTNGNIPSARISATLDSYISKQALRDALSSNLSTLTPVNYNDPQDAALSVLWKNVGILQNALSSVMEMANS